MSATQQTVTRVRRWVRMFKPQFAGMVADGRKCQTVRPVPKRMPQPGDTISLRCWEGKPYRSKQKVLREAVITEVQRIDIDDRGFVWLDDFRIKFLSDWEKFTAADGFPKPEDFIEWFRQQHGLPFTGIVLHWENQKDQPPEARQ